MGFFSKLFGLGGKEDAFGDQMFQSDEDKLKNVQKAAEGVKQLLSGGSIAQQGDRKVLVRGTLEGRATSIEFDITFGGFEIEMRTACARPDSRMSLAHDSDGPGARIPGAIQEPDSFGNVKVFLSKTIYLEGEPEEIAAWQALLGRLPQTVSQKMLDHLETHQARATFTENQISIAPWKGDVARRDALDRIRAHLQLATEIAQATEITWR